MIKHPSVDTENLRITKRTNKHSLEWGSNSINLIHLQSFRRGEGEKKDSLILTLSYSEVELPCRTPTIMLSVMDELQMYLDSMNVIEIPPLKEAKEKVIAPIITPTQVIKLGNKKQIPLIGLKEISCEGATVALYYEQSHEPKMYKAENATEANLIMEQASEHINKMQLLKIFKSLQLNNPFASAADLWKKAEETQELLVANKIHIFY